MNAILEFVFLFTLGLFMFLGIFYMLKLSGSQVHAYDFNIKTEKVRNDIVESLTALQSMNLSEASVVLRTPEKISGMSYTLSIIPPYITFYSQDNLLRDNYSLDVLDVSSLYRSSSGQRLVIAYFNNNYVIKPLLKG